ncbi:hypothetical protein [Methylobrevis pamukkalensis]|uniref:Uncharacterized protein n=1 Tax=Methylobrevis pamukkalensis TaxID=1439726 RepID=A0A1E3H4J2_9HYPH|nr:hypothetical protein [Methylobrevis pamukkalensis]ODN71232.1 hypothetical protein A6302_01429 [Methylobrevis pamukkalensis]
MTASSATPQTLRLDFVCGDLRLEVACEPARAPRTFAALGATLPLDVDLHCPKIAGSHIYWHAPFLADVEGAIDVMDAAPGAFIYWPERQFLELVYAPLQAETAAVTWLGHAVGDIAGLKALGEGLRRSHGRRRTTARLSAPEFAPTTPAEKPGVPTEIVATRKALWARRPADIAGLLASRALMHPAGPLFMAESEARILHEFLWRLRGREQGAGRFAANIAALKAADRLEGFCHLGLCGGAVRRLAAAFLDTSIPFAPLLEEAVLTAGRIAASLDLEIPWHDVNVATRNALDARDGQDAAVEIVT